MFYGKQFETISINKLQFIENHPQNIQQVNLDVVPFHPEENSGGG
jgi:hypothetical protein